MHGAGVLINCHTEKNVTLHFCKEYVFSSVFYFAGHVTEVNAHIFCNVKSFSSERTMNTVQQFLILTAFLIMVELPAAVWEQSFRSYV